MTEANGPSFYNGVLVECALTPTTGTYAGQRVSFPTEEVHAEFSQDVAEHKRPYVPGARIESTGVNPIRFRVKAPFLFGLQAGQGETWGSLYPDTFSLLFLVLTDTLSPTCTFQHPTMGIFNVKPVRGSTSVSPAIKNGQILDFELIQCNIDSDSTSNVANQGEFGAATSSANSFDDLVAQAQETLDGVDLTELLSGIPDPANLFAQITGIVTSVSGTGQTVDQQCNAVSNDLSTLDATLKRTNSASTANLEIQVQKMKSGIYALQKKTPQTNTFTVPRQMTLSAVALQVQNSVEQLMANNAGLGGPLIAAGTVVVVSAPQ